MGEKLRKIIEEAVADDTFLNRGLGTITYYFTANKEILDLYFPAGKYPEAVSAEISVEVPADPSSTLGRRAVSASVSISPTKEVEGGTEDYDWSTVSMSPCYVSNLLARYEIFQDWYEVLTERLVTATGCVKSDGDEILCRTEDGANAIADMIEGLYAAQSLMVNVTTGYYDPEEDAVSGETDEYTGWHYVRVE